MEETNIWKHVFHHIKMMERIQVDLDMARSGRDKEIANIYRNGVGVSEIARRLGLSRTTILRILDEQNAKE